MNLLDLLAPPPYVPAVGEGRVHRMGNPTDPPDDWLVCRDCGTEMAPSNFYYSVGRGGYSPRCKACDKKISMANKAKRRMRPS